MEDIKIIELFFNRDETAIQELSNKYSGYYCYFVLSCISPSPANQCVDKLISRTILRLNFLFLSCKIVSRINLSAHQSVFEVTIPLTCLRIRLHRYKSLSKTIDVFYYIARIIN